MEDCRKDLTLLTTYHQRCRICEVRGIWSCWAIKKEKAILLQSANEHNRCACLTVHLCYHALWRRALH